MNFIAILVALGLEQWRAFQWRNGVQRLFGRYARFLERRFNAGTEQQGARTPLLPMGRRRAGRRRAGPGGGAAFRAMARCRGDADGTPARFVRPAGAAPGVLAGLD